MRALWECLSETLGADFAGDPSLQNDIRRLSRAFTEERESLSTDYLAQPAFLRAYLAYFLPLGFEKVRAVLDHHSGVWKPSPPQETARWVDLGCGPGTATLAALASFRDRYRKAAALPRIQIDLIDRQPKALETAEDLVRKFARKLGLEVEVRCHGELNTLGRDGGFDLALATNVLNELPGGGDGAEPLARLWEDTRGLLALLEPGHRVSSQRLVRFRERLLRDAPQARILGPCLHAERCPVNRTKHWCHFSEPVTDGRLIDLNLRVFKNPRNWLKFSYLLVRRPDAAAGPKASQACDSRAQDARARGHGGPWSKPEMALAPRRHPDRKPRRLYRAIGDLHPAGPRNVAIDLCQPSEKFVLRLPKNLPPELKTTLVRGAIVGVDSHGRVDARPMTGRR